MRLTTIVIGNILRSHWVEWDLVVFLVAVLDLPVRISLFSTMWLTMGAWVHTRPASSGRRICRQHVVFKIAI